MIDSPLEFTTSETLLATYLLYKGIELKEITPDKNNSKIFFVFSANNHKIAQLNNEYLLGQVKVNLPALFSIYRSLIDRVQEAKRGK
jgi:hypothetical protein